MDLGNANVLGALAGAVVAMAIGALWYSPLLFGKRWQSLIGRQPDEMGNPMVSMALATVMFILLGVGLSWIMPDGASVGIGLMWGFLAFWGFVIPAVVVNAAFENRGWTLVLMYLGYMLVALLAMGAVIALLGG
jgi:hypothetical protein